jgi:hypothetical protein
MQQDYFNWRAWPNFSSDGPPPSLNKYQLRPLAPGQETPLANTPLSVRAFALSHGPDMQSTAFLVRSGASYLLYLGDTGADEVEQSHCLHDLWLAVRPLVHAHQLKAIFIEASYPNVQPPAQLFGHLTPALLRELGEASRPGGLAWAACYYHPSQAYAGQRSPYQRAANGWQCAGATAYFSGARPGVTILKVARTLRVPT